jgi:polyisoprenoid-binding protein YceI
VKHVRTLLVAALALGTLGAISAPATAAPEKFVIDPVHSLAGFKIRHFFSNVTGRFAQMSGTIMFDQKDLAASSVEVTIPTASITTQNDRRDNHLRSADFFAADSFPNVTFKSTKVTPGADNKFQIEGDLTMRGVTRKVVLDATLLGVGSVGMMGTRAGFEATTKVNRKEYGISWNRTLDQGGTMLGDDVDISLAIEAAKEEPKKDAPPSK